MSFDLKNAWYEPFDTILENFSNYSELLYKTNWFALPISSFWTFYLIQNHILMVNLAF